MSITIPGLGEFGAESGLIRLSACSDGRFRPGADGVISVAATGDGKVEFIAFADHTLAYVRSALGYPAYYPVHPVALERPVRAVLMDLDGTSVRSERFWIWIIEQTTASLLGNPRFALGRERSALRLRPQRLRAPRVLHPQVLPRPDGGGGAGNLLRAHPA